MLKMFEKGTKQKGHRYLLQKNARGPVCAGTLKRGENTEHILISCINCGVKMKIVEFGKFSSDLIVEVI